MIKIKRIEFGNIHIDDEVFNRDDFFLFKNLIEPAEKSHIISTKDFKHMMLREPEIVIFGLGFNNAAKVEKSVHELAKKLNVEIYELSTPDALKKFQELTKLGKNVAARIHITC